MRTTIDIPDDLHRIASAIARDQSTTLSEAVTSLLRSAVGSPGSAITERSERTGITTLKLGRIITGDDVRALDDD